MRQAQLTHQILREVLQVRPYIYVLVLPYTTDTCVRRTRFYVCVRKLRTTFCSGRTTFCRGVRGHAGKRAGRRRRRAGDVQEYGTYSTPHCAARTIERRAGTEGRGVCRNVSIRQHTSANGAQQRLPEAAAAAAAAERAGSPGKVRAHSGAAHRALPRVCHACVRGIRAYAPGRGHGAQRQRESGCS